MPPTIAPDDAARSSLRAVVLCVGGSAFAAGVAWLLTTFTALTSLPVGTFLGTLFLILVADWALRCHGPTCDPSATFITYLFSSACGLWIIDHFFIAPGLGPFAGELWTAQNVLANAVFGLSTFAVAGAIAGMTYYVARRSYADVFWRRALFAIVGVGVPIYAVARLEYILVAFLS